MNANDIAAVTIPVVALTQLFKWFGLVPDTKGPLSVLGLSALGVLLWAISQETAALNRQNAFDLFTGFALVATSAAGVFGFTRAAPEAVTATTQPPPGAGSNPT
jgi:hypothetical protein